MDAALFSPAYARDPWPTLDRLLAHDPLHELGGLRVVTRPEDCAAVLTSPDMSAAGGQADRRDTAGVPASMLTTDGAEHERLRRPAGLLLGPAGVAAAAPGVARRIADLLDGLPTGEVDLGTGVAEPFATAVLAELLDVPDDGWAPFDAHCRAVEVALDPRPDPATAARIRVAMGGFGAYLADVVAAARTRPADTPLGALVHDGRLDDGEVAAVLSLAVVGGWRPLADVGATALWVALADPTVGRRCGEPGGAEEVVEEVLRWHSPVPFVARRSTAAVPLPAGKVPAGTTVLAVLAAANHAGPDDPHAFRPGRSGPRHVAFGLGPHFCLGAPAVRSAVPTLLREVLHRFPAASVTKPQVSWRPGVFPRRVGSTPVRFS